MTAGTERHSAEATDGLAGEDPNGKPEEGTA